MNLDKIPWALPVGASCGVDLSRRSSQSEVGSLKGEAPSLMPFEHLYILNQDVKSRILRGCISFINPEPWTLNLEPLNSVALLKVHWPLGILDALNRACPVECSLAALRQEDSTGEPFLKGRLKKQAIPVAQCGTTEIALTRTPHEGRHRG